MFFEIVAQYCLIAPNADKPQPKRIKRKDARGQRRKEEILTLGVFAPLHLFFAEDGLSGLGDWGLMALPYLPSLLYSHFYRIFKHVQRLVNQVIGVGSAKEPGFAGIGFGPNAHVIHIH